MAINWKHGAEEADGTAERHERKKWRKAKGHSE